MASFPSELNEQPKCEHCKMRIGIHAVPTKTSGKFMFLCHPCYEELMTPVTKADLKDVIKEALKEYDEIRND